MRRLNVGCGNHYADGWVNVDRTMNAEVRPDVQGDLRQSEFLDTLVDPIVGQGAGRFDRLYMGHVLEHIPYVEVPEVLRNLDRILKPGAWIGAVGPDVNRARAMFETGQIDQAQLDATMEGGSRWDGDRHHWNCTEESLVALLRLQWPTAHAVWPMERMHADEWPLVSAIGWQCAAVAQKPPR